MKVKSPIIIIGAGRSGSTIFHKVFAKYDKLAWLSGFVDKTPTDFNKHKMLMQGIDLPLIGPLLMKKYTPSEGYNFWNYYAKGFGTPFRDLTKDDLTNVSKKKIIDAMGNLLNKSRNRLLLKITGWPRVSYLKEIFPDAKFIHIIRDGRAVANSLINVDFWWGWRGPNNWRWGELPDKYYNEWIRFDKAFIALAAIEWKIIMDAHEKGKELLDNNNFLEIKYEDLCENPLNEFNKVFDFVELDFTTKFQAIVSGTTFRNTNSKWQKELNEKQKYILNEILQNYLIKFGYITI